MDDNDVPVFSAVSNSTHHLYVLLGCIGFGSKAAVQITSQGVRFSVDEGRVMQGLAFLEKALFTNYIFNNPQDSSTGAGDQQSEQEDDAFAGPRFLISLSALIETLQIFGVNDSSSAMNQTSNAANPTALNAFSTPALLMSRSCTISYIRPGSPLCITLTEAGVTTTCELTTYELDDPALEQAPGNMDIPFQREDIALKLIMRSAWLHNAITELDSTTPTVLSLSASATRAPFFALSASGGPFSESTVEFSVDKEASNANDPAYRTLENDGIPRQQPKRGKLAPAVTETFLVNPSPNESRVRQSYRFALVHKALRAMAVSSKVSIRSDRQGVLSLQFMIELGENGIGDAAAAAPQPAAVSPNGVVSFVDFRFVPLVDEDEEETASAGSESDGRT